MDNIDLQKESSLEAVDKHTVGKGILFPLQLLVWMPGAFVKKFSTVWCTHCRIKDKLCCHHFETISLLFESLLGKNLKTFFHRASESSLSNKRCCQPFGGVKFCEVLPGLCCFCLVGVFSFKVFLVWSWNGTMVQLPSGSYFSFNLKNQTIKHTHKNSLSFPVY